MNYKPRTIKIPPQGYGEVDISGVYLRILESDAPFKIGFDRDSVEWVWAGLQIKTEGFKKLRFENESDADISITFAASVEGVDDTRLQFTGNLKTEILNFPAAPDPVAEKDLRKGLVPVGSSFVRFSAASGILKLVDPALNINGVIVRFVSVYQGGGTSYLLAKSQQPSSWSDTNAIQIMMRTSGETGETGSFLLPAGMGLWNAPSGGIFYGGANFDLL